MELNNKSFSDNYIRYVQSTLSDFIDGVPDFDEVLDKRLNKDVSFDINNDLEIDGNNTFKYVDPVCPRCGSREIIKKGTISKIKQNVIGRDVELKEQQYKCKCCNRRFGIKNSLFDDDKYFFKEISDKVPKIIKKGYCSLRRIKHYFKIYLNVDIAHTTIRNWLKINEDTIIINKDAKGSGFYLYDEQFLKLNGVRWYRVTIFDSQDEIPISEGIVKKRTPSKIKKFIQISLKDKPIRAISTDLYPMYRNILDELGIDQQLCIIHLRRTVYKKLREYVKKEKPDEEETRQMYENAKKFMKLFKENNYFLAKQKYDNYIKRFDEIPEALKSFMEKNVVNHIERYILFLKNPKIEKTSNKLDNFYRNTDPEIIKKRYKTPEGVLTYLYYKMIEWTERKKEKME